MSFSSKTAKRTVFRTLKGTKKNIVAVLDKKSTRNLYIKCKLFNYNIS